MNPTVRAALDTRGAELRRLVPVPVAPLGYGRDLACTIEIDPALAEVDPDSPTAITQALIRRYITPRGALIDDANYGLDIRGHLNRGTTTRELAAMGGMMRGEAQKDDRVARVDVALSASLITKVLEARVNVEPEDPALVAFDFTIAVASGADLEVTIHG